MTATGATTSQTTTGWTRTGSPIGELTLVADDGRLTGVYFPHHWYRPEQAMDGWAKVFDFFGRHLNG